MAVQGVAWFYVCTKEAAPILKKIFEKGVAPGSVTTIPTEDIEILQEGVLYLPVQIVNRSKIVTPGTAH